MELSGWGRYPRINSIVTEAASVSELQARVISGTRGIARGMGRSYGDSALAEQVLGSHHLDHFIDFDNDTGILTCEAGVTLADIIQVLLPRGWFLPVTPGTQFVSVGGAIASDVHGKNHHLVGSFANHVLDFDLLVANGEILRCSPVEHSLLFQATCGGMGLTGIILRARLQLQRISSSYIDETTYKARNLEHILDLFEEHTTATYSVAWIDCLAKGQNLGRSLLMLGEHSPNGGLGLENSRALGVPMDMPDQLLNPCTIAAFNQLYYQRIRQPSVRRHTYFKPFFYPLDAIANWNRMYGAKGFVQYQFVLPKAAGINALRDLLQRIVNCGKGSFLAVLKAFGPGNDNYLSFPTEGYTLALDFKLDDRILALLNELDERVLDYGGRLYLTKDARMSEQTFKRSYPRWQEFAQVRERYGATGVFCSLQSRRLGLD